MDPASTRDGRFSAVVVAPPTTPLKVGELAGLPVPALAADDAVVWLWTTGPGLAEALAALNSWGFEYETTVTWFRTEKVPGRRFEETTLHCLVGVRGNCPAPATWGTTAMWEQGVTDYPNLAKFHRLVEGACPGAKVELFARRGRPGWNCRTRRPNRRTWSIFPEPGVPSGPGGSTP
jgi:N6-adenosine-specific RNA methylase IME4